MTRKVEGLDILDSQELLNINPRDADELGIADGELIEVSSRRGKIKVRSRVTEVCPPQVVSMTFHFAETPTNVLTNSALDPSLPDPLNRVAFHSKSSKPRRNVNYLTKKTCNS